MGSGTMSTDWQRVKDLLAEAAACSSREARAAFLDRACSDDPALRTQVEALLRAHDEAGEFLETPALLPPGPAATLAAPRSIGIGDGIGPYRLVQQIGEGGCGTVYLAQQDHPIRRQVALKIIKLGMDCAAVIARFEAERQALALMDHPNIARVLDAGATDTGRPYFVMELVRGIRITEYCDQNQLSTEDRLTLFVQVCHALQHAHQKGIIHRDIKPSNVLVTLHDGAPVPKIIDFGIAKATEQRLTDKTLVTVAEQFLGTPAYMSPEQAAMTSLDLDTRSDLYALGVLLYELLTGRTPFEQRELTAAGLDEMRRIIRNVEPARPSTRLTRLAPSEQTTVAQRRQSQPPQLISRLRGDLDWIVMRCLEKDRTRRYETANSLAEDLLRHLRDEPVMARPPSRRDQFEKLVRRNKATFTAVTLVTLALVLGLGFSLWTLGRERAARHVALQAGQRAQAEAVKSQQVAHFLKDLLQGVGPSVALGRDTTMLREILDKTAARVGRDLQDQPEVEAELQATLGEVYQALGQFDQAESMYRSALALRRTLHGNMHTNVADILDLLGHELDSCRSETVESRALLQEALMIRTNLLGPQHVQVAASLQHLAFQTPDRLDEAEDFLQRALAMRRQLLGNDCAEVAESLTELANLMTWQARQDEAEAYAREALAVLSRMPQDDTAPQRVAFAQVALGRILDRQGKEEEALSLQRMALKTIKQLVGDSHVTYAGFLYNLGYTLHDANQLDEAESVMREALAIFRRTVGDQNMDTRYCLGQLAGIAEKRGRLADAEAAYREANPERLHPGLIRVLRAQGKHAEAEAALAGAALKARELADKARATPNPEAALEALLWLVDVHWLQGNVAAAGSVLNEAIEWVGGNTPPAALPDRLSFMALKHAALQVWFGMEAEHAALSRRMMQWSAAEPRFIPKGRAARMLNLRPVNDPRLQAEALVLARTALEAAPTNALLVWFRLNVGVAEFRLGHYPEAEQMLLASEQGGPALWHPAARTCASQFYRAMILHHQGHEARARQLFTEAETAMPPVPAAVHHALVEDADCDELMLWLAYQEARAALNPLTNGR